jgi:hypothetical protein
MTEVTEKVAFGEVLGEDVKCPFDHTNKEPPTVENNFKGEASELDQNMANQKSTCLYLKATPKKVTNPNDRPRHKFWDGKDEKDWPVSIPWKDEKTGKSGVHKYPVTCAAHHLIPAQASLKPAKMLHPFMIWKEETEPVKVWNKKGETKEKPLPKGVVYADVGYDVNGSENGIFLPGNYGVSKTGMPSNPLWTSAPSVLPGDDEDDDDDDNMYVKKPRTCSSPKLTGDRHQISNQNRKWQYVKQAVEIGGQFHDSHVDYNLFVLEILQKIGSEYNERLEKNKSKQPDCPECQKRLKEFENQGVPTPFALVNRLNGVSNRLAGFLKGKRWCERICTSKWGVAYIREKRKGNPDAD